MLDTLGLLPKSIAPAAIAYLVLCYGLGDVFAQRRADWLHIPACQKGLGANAAEADVQTGLQQKLVRKYVDIIIKTLPPSMPKDVVKDLNDLTRPELTANRAQTFADRCTCLASAARSETRFDQTIWVASLRFVEPAGVSNFHGVMTRLDGQGICGKGRS
jgi:hypothetical protein